MFELLTGLRPLVVFGLASAVLSILAYFPYIVDTLAGRTRPQRASWLIWSVLGSIAVLSQWHEGATHSLWFAMAQVGGTICVFVLSILFGVGGFLSRRDRWVLGTAALGLGAWYVTDTPAYALAITIVISLIGGVATVAKSYTAPETETLSAWVLSGLGSIFALLAVGPSGGILLAYPLYLLILNGTIIMAVVLGRRWKPTPMAWILRPLHGQHSQIM